MTTTTVRLHAGTVADFSSTFGTGGGLTGSGALWDDASDSTYLESKALPATTIAQGEAPLDDLVLPSNATVTGVTFNVRLQQTSGTYQTHVGLVVRASTHTGNQFGPSSPSGDVKGISIPSSGSILDLSVAASDFSSWSVGSLAGLVTLLSASSTNISARNVPDLNGSFVTIASTIRVYELSVDVTYTTPDTGIAPLRLTNRDDQYSSAPSLTRRTSRQGSNRLTGYL